MPHPDKLAVQNIAAGTCFMAEVQPRSASRQLLNQFADMIGPVRHRSPVAHLTTAFALRTCDRYRRLVDIQPDESAILHAVPPPVLRPGTRQSGATPDQRMPQERPLTQSD
jgi:hypothetical protein